MQPVLIVGMGVDGPGSIAPDVRRRIELADELWGATRLLDCWPDSPAEKRELSANIPQLIERLRTRGDRRIVVLASGDPGFYGIAGTLLRHFPAEELEIVPGVGSLPLAFARAGVAWSDAHFDERPRPAAGGDRRLGKASAKVGHPDRSRADAGTYRAGATGRRAGRLPRRRGREPGRRPPSG